MIIDFSKIGGEGNIDKLTNPREIFMALPGKAKKYEYPRDVQTEVWNQWFELRDEHVDNIIKMNTGSGKTVVGLLILKSCLNEGKGPAVYVVPDPYLVNQVIAEAKALGLEVATDENDYSYIRGRSILIINIHKLINGKSVFGMRPGGNNVPIGSVLIDDVHACLNTTESQFTIEIKRDDDKYAQLYSLLVNDLKQQSDTKVLEIEERIPNASMLVPFWAWQNKIEDVNRILFNGREDRDIAFSYPLIKDCIRLCNCVIATDKIEITPKSIPIHKISSFKNAKRRIFMSATLSDDSIFVSHLDVDMGKIKSVITPEKADDMGDRLILFPQVINSLINDDELKSKFKELSLRKNVVVIVPSTYRSEYWRGVADLILNSADLSEGVKRLKSGHVGLVVLVNKYDGIDLPGEACSVLVIDGLPDTRSEYDKIEQSALYSSSRIISEKVQRVEQGMGRGVRSNTDYCVVFLMGRGLTNTLYGEGALDKFSATTRAQLELSEKISNQVKDKPIGDIFSIIDYSLERKKEWVSASKSILTYIKYDKSKNVNPIILANRNAFNFAEKRDYQSAVDTIDEIVNKCEDIQMRGWLKQQLAEYTNLINPIDAQMILKSALADNIQVLKPIDGIQYDKKLKKYRAQGQQFVSFINRYGFDENRFILKVNDILDKLQFKPDTANVFEKAFNDIAYFIGFSARRPESEVGRGPDVLWRIGELKFLVIECKNGVTNEVICKHDCNQLNGSANWFTMNYDNSCECTPIMIHLGNVFEYASSPDARVRIINREKLDLLKANIQKFAQNVVLSGNFNNVENVNALLQEYRLTPEKIIDIYTTTFSIKSVI